MTKPQRARYEKKQEKLRKSLPKKIPLHEQSIDLTPADATAEQSLDARQALTKSARDARRKAIRERNFLVSM
jgi:large subunit ribosomal protein L54